MTTPAPQRRRAVALTACLALYGCADPPPTAPTANNALVVAVPAARTASNRVAATIERHLPDGFPFPVRDCVDCYLRWADLPDADLSGGDLRRSDLSRANLQGADLSDADLRGADLSHARLGGADLSGALWVDGTVCANGSVGRCRPASDNPLLEALATAAVLPTPGTASFKIASGDDDLLDVRVTKWYGGHRAAVTLTYDSAYGTWYNHSSIADLAAREGLPINHELVTSFYEQPLYYPLLQNIRRELVARDRHLYGHGHLHVDHDALSYEDALASFRRCYQLMEHWGLRPRAYAYPHSAGLAQSTQRAVRDAGFICARGSSLGLDEIYICPDDTVEPENWYYLPAVSVAGEFDNYIHNHAELVPVLEEGLERTAWVIVMYHAIGMPLGWGYYPTRNFRQDVAWMGDQDFWGANMDDAAAYIRERNNLRVTLESVTASGDILLSFEDGLDDEIYDQPLTIDIEPRADLATERIRVRTPGGRRFVEVVDGRARLDVRPDGGVYTLRLY